MTLKEYFGDWSDVIDLEEADRVMKRIIPQKNSVCPLVKDIFKAFKLCRKADLKVVILGYDPYADIRNGEPVATGIAFANHKDTPQDSYSPSLEILKDSVIDFTKPHGTINFDPTLEKWEEQGVLMLNSALTCQKGRTGSHTLMWRPFIASLLTNLSKELTGIVYILMGNVAQSFESYISQNANHIIKVRHPAYYARNHARMPPDVWKKIDNILYGMYGEKIKWFTEV